VLEGTVRVWKSVDNAEILANGSSKSPTYGVRGCGINGENVIILDTRVVVTEIGEADDVQANIFLTFGEENHI